MDSHWQQVRLGEIAKPVNRPIEVIAGQPYRTVGVKWWGQGAYERQTIDGSKTAAKTLSLVREGDLIINKIWVRHGSTAIASSAVDGCTASGEFPTFSLNLHRVLSRWIHWLTKTPSFWEKCDALSRGTSGRNRIKPELFLTIRVPLPAFAEQNRIVSRIEQLAKNIDHASNLRARISEVLSSFVTSLHIDLSGPRVLKVGEILSLDEQRCPVRADTEYPQVGIRAYGAGLFAKPPIVGTETTYKEFNRLFEGALVLSQVKGWEGAIAVCTTEFAGLFASPEYRTFRCVAALAEPRYLAALVATPWFHGKLANLTRGVGARRERIRPEAFLEMEIPWPELTRQQRALEVLGKLKLLQSYQSQTAAELDALMPSILSKAFSGEL